MAKSSTDAGVQRAFEDVKQLITDVEDRLFEPSGKSTPAAKQASAKKTAAARKRKGRQRQAAAKKAARTRAQAKASPPTSTSRAH
jgi:ElaB/YqjD/DUF883 family membrane-anchored ribosome-binding protein